MSGLSASVLPIVERELIVRARSARTQWGRVAVAGLAVLFSFQLLLVEVFRVTLLQQGTVIFAFQSGIGICLACAACLLTANAICPERREGTLGLLFLTRLGGWDVVLGKLAAHGLTALYAGVALAPALMLPVLTGGVTWSAVAYRASGLANLLFLSLCVGIWASATAQTFKLAAIRSVGLVLLLIPGGMILLLTLVRLASSQTLRWLPLPGSVFLLSTQGVPVAGVGAFWLSMAVGQGVGWLFLWNAARSLHRNWRDAGVPDPSEGEGRQEVGPSVPGAQAPEAPSRAARTRRVSDKESPIAWLLRRDGAQAGLLWVAAGLSVLGAVPALQILLSRFGFGIGSWAVLSAYNFVIYVGLHALFVFAAARGFLDARRSGALELLMCTPRGAADMLEQQWGVLRQRLMWPLVVVVAAGLLRRVPNALAMRGAMGIDALWMLQPLLGVAQVVIDVVALSWLGMWFGVRARTPLVAVLIPVCLVTGLDVALSYGIYFAALALSPGGSVLPGLWVAPIATMGKQLWLMRWAAQRLQAAFSGGGVEPLDLRAAGRAFWNLRHWTPADKHTQEGGSS